MEEHSAKGCLRSSNGRFQASHIAKPSRPTVQRNLVLVNLKHIIES